MTRTTTGQACRWSALQRSEGHAGAIVTRFAVGVLVLASGCGPPPRKVEYAPGDSHRTFATRAEALSIVRASWDYTERSGYETRRATDAGLVLTYNHSAPGYADILNPFRGRETHTCPYHTITRCEITEGGHLAGTFWVSIHSTTSPVRGDSASAWHSAYFAQDQEKAIVFADALLYLAKPHLFHETKAKQEAKSPEEPKPSANQPEQSVEKRSNVAGDKYVGAVESVNQRWDFVLVTPVSAEHGLGPGKKLACKRGGRLITTLVVTKVTPSSLTMKVRQADALLLVQVGDKVYEE